MKWDQIKKFVFGGAGAVVFLLIMGFIDWRIGVKVDAALAAQDLGTDIKIINMDKATATNTSGVSENKEDITVNRQNVERAFDFLMGASNDD